MKRKFGKAIIILLAAFVVLSSSAAIAKFAKNASKLVSLFPRSEFMQKND